MSAPHTPAPVNVTIPQPAEVLAEIERKRADMKRLNRLYRLSCDTYGKPAVEKPTLAEGTAAA